MFIRLHMKIKFCLLLFSFFALFQCPCTADERQLSIQEAKLLLTSALEYSVHTPFCAETSFNNADGTSKTTRYFNNGKLLLVQFETGTRKIPSQRLIDFEAGLEYYWLEEATANGKIVVFKKNYLPGNYIWECVHGMLDEKRLSQGQYSIKDTIYDGVPCWGLKICYPNTDSAILNAPATHFIWHTYQTLFPTVPHLNHHRLSPQEYQKNKNELKIAYFCVFEIFIGNTPEHPFIYNMQAYGSDGQVIDNFSQLGHVTFTDKFPGSCQFEYPSDAIVVGSETYEDFGNQFLEAYPSSYVMSSGGSDRAQAWQQGILQKCWLHFRHDPLQFLISGLYWLAIVVAVASLAACIVLKIRDWRQR